MKKTLFSITLLLFSYSSASAVVVYNKDGQEFSIRGQFRPMITIKDGERTDLRDRGSRVEFLGSQKLSYGFKTIIKTRITFTGKNSNSSYSGFGDPTTEQLYMGFEHNDIGRLYFGKLPTNGDAIMLGDWHLNCCGSNPLTSFAKKGINFKSALLGGFQFGIDYIFGESIKERGNVNKFKNGYGASIFYNVKLNKDMQVRLRAGYTRDNYDVYKFSHVNTVWIENNVSREAWRVSSEFKYELLTLAYNYGEIKNLEKNSLLSNRIKEKRHLLAAKYDLISQVALYGQYRHEKKLKNINHGFSIGIDYRPIKNLITFVEFSRNRNIRNVNAASDYKNIYAIGFRLLF